MLLLKKIAFVLMCLLGSAVNVHAKAVLPDNVQHFAIGSCAKERLPQPIWDTVLKQEPQFFVFLGDNVYADYWAPEGKTLDSHPVSTIERFEEAYRDLASKPGFTALRSKMPVIGIWDDHDYGANDAGRHYPMKWQSQSHFFDFFGFAKDDPIRKQSGIYHSFINGDVGQRVQFIMLDTRFHRDDLVRNPEGQPEGKGPYIQDHNEGKSILGFDQWNWLEQQLLQPADIRFIASSIQVVAYEHSWETWGNFPAERQKLYDLIEKTNAKGVVFLSGDRHLTEVSVDTGQLGSRVPYPMWDLTVSGMTDDIREVNEVNNFRQGAVYRGSHFATVSIHWQENDAEIRFKALDLNGDLINAQTIPLSLLR